MMRISRRAPFRLIYAAASLALAAACAAAPPRDVPTLEARAAAAPGDTESALRLAAAYRDAGRLDDARPLLETAVANAP
ncbi:MAG TPA: hypothetical protein VFX98_08260, partial [Longimicrobiaceae bacterium]|nr:hypothetical protein [Longimicrobiaceae bacterium]